MSDFAFKMSSLDRKLAIGEMVSPSDVNYDPEAHDYPDPLEHPEAAVQHLLQEINSAKRSEALTSDDLQEIESFESIMMDFLHTCCDENLGPDDLPGTGIILDMFLDNDGKNGISTVASMQKEAIPILPLVGALAGFLARGTAWEAGKKLLGMGSGEGEGQGQAPTTPPIQTSDYNLGPVQSNNRYEMPIDHVLDNLMFESATSPGPKKRNEDIETLRAQVIAALKAWADAGESENRAEWWVYFSYAHEASTIAELQTILTAVPAEYHNAVMTSPLPAGSAPTPGDSGLPEVTDPAEGAASVATPSPVPIDGAGTPPKMPEGQGLIPGALATHDKLKVKPIFATTDESAFEDYAEEDRPVLAKVAKFIEAGVHEEEIVNTLSPSYGLEKTMWAVDQATKVANNDPLVDPAVALLNVPWKSANFLDKDYIEVGNWIAENHPETVSDRKEMGFETDPLSLGKDYLEEEGEWEFKELLNFSRDIDDKLFESSGANEDTKINQQEDSNLVTPHYEKNDTHRVADYTSTSVGTGISPYSQGYNEAMGWNQAINQGVNMPSATGLPPNPIALTEAEKKQQEEQRLQQMFPNVPTEIAKKFVNVQHPVQPNVTPSSGDKANPTATQLPSSTVSKVASWKDVNGNLLERGRLYKMTSPEYPVPDFVRVVNNGPDRLDIHITKSDVDLSLNEEKIRTSKFRFEPMEEEKTAAIEKEAYYLPGYHALVSVRNPNTGGWQTQIAPNDQQDHLETMWDALNSNPELKEAYDQSEEGNFYDDHTIRGLYNPQTKKLVHFTHPDYNPFAGGGSQKGNLKPEDRPIVERQWRELAGQAGLPVEDYGIFGEEGEGEDYAAPTEFRDPILQQLRDKWQPAQEDPKTVGIAGRPGYLDRSFQQRRKKELEQQGLSSEEVMRRLQLENFNEKYRREFLRGAKTASLSTSQQRELIDEKGVARNLDRLNLEGTHYPELANFEQTATLEEQSPEISMWSGQEDLDLFL